MAEFKVSSELSNEVNDIETKGYAINGSYTDVSDDGVETLATSLSYIDQHKDIKELLNLYKTLIIKDAEDLHSMILEAENMDKTIATNTTKQI